MSIFLILPGDSAAYSPLVLGLYLDQIVRKVDPQKRGLGEYFRTEIAEPFGKWAVKERKKTTTRKHNFLQDCTDANFLSLHWFAI